MNQWLAILVILLTWVCPIKAGSATLEWDASTDDNIAYTIEIKPGGELDPGEWKAVASTTELFLKVDKLTPGLYSFRALAVHTPTGLTSKPSNVVTTTVIPDAPTIRVALQSSKDMKTWTTEITADIPKTDRQFFRTAFIDP